MPYSELDLDEDREPADWFELVNQSSSPVNLSGWSITDDLEEPAKWVFPAVNLAAGEYMQIWASDKDRSELMQYRTLVPLNTEFSYIVPDEDTAPDWTTADELSPAWLTGPSGIGYGDDDDATIIGEEVVAVYMRTEFNVEDPEAITQLILDIDYDDGFIAYLNGFEIARGNMPVESSFDTLASAEREATFFTASVTERFVIEPEDSPLLEGRNIFAVQVHNASATSSDLTAIPILSAVVSSTEIGVEPDPRLNFSSFALHTNFKISNDGEGLYLFNPQQELVSDLTIPQIPLGTSFGLSTQSGTPAIFTQPTPGAANASRAYSGVSNSTINFYFDGEPGGPGILTLDGAGEDEEIRFTLDGGEPNESSPVYTGPIPIEVTTAVRARAYHATNAPSPTVSQTYLVNASHSVNVISLVTDPLNLFDLEYGMYALGPIFEPEFPFYGANFWQDWERRAHFAFYNQNGEVQIQQDIGIDIFGGWSRANGQKSLALQARSRYGAERFEFPFFANRNYQTFKNLVLRNSGNDWLSTGIRDAVMTSLMEGSGLDYQAYRPTVLYMNGEYWGIHNLREKVNEHFLGNLHGIDPDEIVLLELNAREIEGSNEEYLALIDFIENNSLAVNENYQVVADQIDLDNFITYQIAQIYFNNTDWPGNNIKYWKSPETKWRWILFDTDFGFNLYSNAGFTQNTLVHATLPDSEDISNAPWSTLLLRSLLSNAEFQQRFITRMADELNFRFNSARVRARAAEYASAIESEIPAHYRRWGLTLPRMLEPTDENYLAHWQAELDDMYNFIEQRPVYLTEHVIDFFDLEGAASLILDFAADGGRVLVNSKPVNSAPWNGTYFAGQSITVNAEAKEGYAFSHWLHDPENTDPVISLVAEADQVIELSPVFVAL